MVTPEQAKRVQMILDGRWEEYKATVEPERWFLILDGIARQKKTKRPR